MFKQRQYKRTGAEYFKIPNMSLFISYVPPDMTAEFLQLSLVQGGLGKVRLVSFKHKANSKMAKVDFSEWTDTPNNRTFQKRASGEDGFMQARIYYGPEEYFVCTEFNETPTFRPSTQPRPEPQPPVAPVVEETIAEMRVEEKEVGTTEVPDEENGIQEDKEDADYYHLPAAEVAANEDIQDVFHGVDFDEGRCNNCGVKHGPYTSMKVPHPTTYIAHELLAEDFNMDQMTLFTHLKFLEDQERHFGLLVEQAEEDMRSGERRMRRLEHNMKVIDGTYLKYLQMSDTVQIAKERVLSKMLENL